MIKYDFPALRTTVNAIGKTVYILGVSEDGPVMQPIYVKSTTEAESIFGNKMKGTLVRACEEAYDRNSEIAIFLMRISGKSATLKIAGFHRGDLVELLHLRSASGGGRYNDVCVDLEHRADLNENLFVITSGSYRIVYNLEQYQTIGHLVLQINQDCRSNLHGVIVESDYYDAPIMSIVTAFTEKAFLTGGDDGLGLTKDEMYLQYEDACRLLLGKPIDIILPVGVYVDDVHPVALYGEGTYGNAVYASTDDHLQLVDTYNNNRVVSFHEQLIDFCRKQMSFGFMTHGVIGLRPLKVVPDSIEHDYSYIIRLVEATIFKDRYGLLEYKDGQWVDKGYYISVVGGELVFQPDSPAEYFSNGAAAYAALLAGTYETTTNTQVKDVKLRYELPEEVVGELSKLGVVMFQESIRNGIVVASGVTASHYSNELHSVANLRMTQLSLAHVNEVVQQIYESDTDPALRRRLVEERIKERLRQLKSSNILLDYDYRILMNRTNSEGSILLTLHTKYTVEGIGTSAQVGHMGVQ